MDCQKWASVVGCLAFTFWSSSTHTNSIVSAGRAGQDIISVMCFSLLLVPQAEFTRMLWVIILLENKSIAYKPHSRWYHVMLQYVMIAGLIQFAPHLGQIADFAIDTPTYTPLQSFLYALPLVWYRGLKLFHQLFASRRPSYLSQIFST